jgi:hypothetical protein
MIDFKDIIHCNTFIWNDVSETGLCLRSQEKGLLNWAQLIDLGPISRHQKHNKEGFINQTQHKLSAGVNSRK